MRIIGVKRLILTLLSILILICMFIVYSYQKKYYEGKEYLKHTKQQRNSNNNQAVYNLITIIEDENIDKGTRHAAAEMLRKIVKNTDYERDIEDRLYDKYKDGVVCFIEENRCRIILLGKRLKKSEAEYIREIVYDITGIQEIEIELRW